MQRRLADVRGAILIVQPYVSMANLMIDVLAAEGLRRSRAVNNVLSALDYLRAFDVCAVIAEVDLPPRGGLDLCLALRRGSDSPRIDVPIILTSGAITPKMLKAARTFGANHMLRRPFSAKDLVTCLLGVLRSTRPFVDTEGYTGPERRMATETRKLPDDRRLADVPRHSKTPMALLMREDLDVVEQCGDPPERYRFPTLGAQTRQTAAQQSRRTREIPASRLEPGLEIAQTYADRDGTPILQRGSMIKPEMLGPMKQLIESGRLPRMVTVYVG